MAIYTIGKDSYGDYLNFTCTERDGTTPINLTGKTIKVYTWNPRTPATFVINGGTVDIVGAAAGTCRYLTVTGNFPTAGVFFGKLKLTAAGYAMDLPVFYLVVTDGSEYVTLEEVKAELAIENDEKDFILYSHIQRASDFIERYCERSFTSEAAVTKYFDGDTSPLFIDDLVTPTTIKLDEDGDGTYETTLLPADYLLEPYNETPKRRLVLAPQSSVGGFAAGIKRGVEIVGTWGFSAVPEVVTQCTLIQTCRWYKRRDTGYAVVIGSAETGEIPIYHGLDPDIKTMLKTVKRWTHGGI